MMRDGLPRAYLRISPDIDQHPDPLAMVRALCAAHRQPVRGHFRDHRVLERSVGKRPYRDMVQRGDVVPSDGGGVYLDGWDEWQEGDFTVAERMRRMRDRRRKSKGSPVTEPASHDRNDVTTDAGTTTDRDTSLGVGDSVLPPNPPPSGGLRANGTNPRAKAQATADLAKLEENAKRWRRQQRSLAYHRGAITERQLAEMNQADRPLEAIPGYSDVEAIA